MELPINVGLIRNPLNWATVLLMVALGVLVVDSVLAWRNQE